jgi:hypothetical protein
VKIKSGVGGSIETPPGIVQLVSLLDGSSSQWDLVNLTPHDTHPHVNHEVLHVFDTSFHHRTHCKSTTNYGGQVQRPIEEQRRINVDTYEQIHDECIKGLSINQCFWVGFSSLPGKEEL